VSIRREEGSRCNLEMGIRRHGGSRCASEMSAKMDSSSSRGFESCGGRDQFTEMHHPMRRSWVSCSRNQCRAICGRKAMQRSEGVDAAGDFWGAESAFEARRARVSAMELLRDGRSGRRMVEWREVRSVAERICEGVVESAEGKAERTCSR
jgi:hypothetical protein